MDRTTGGVPIEWESGIIDISEMSLEELGTLPADDKSPLASSLRRVAEELTDATEQIAGFNSAL
ncbi:FxSxx-COOH cyclophane-containing RiPP peptide [Actinoplanes sp. NPDC051411]|uniref:FxSxx-COOH cyclophane-containing RiPP peptide n=1 Tax=Actinoplanes sp. NPDC051411 TaxID=3155522 RepID=UPI0034357BEF